MTIRSAFLAGAFAIACSNAQGTSAPPAPQGSGGAPAGTGGATGAGGGAVDAGEETSARADAGAPADAGPRLDAGASVLERNGNAARTGHFIQPTLDRANVARMLLERDYMARFTGDVWASPLYLEQGPGARGAFFVVTTDDQVLAIDERTGSIAWSTTIGPAASATGVPCGDVHPLGILGTPVIDAASRTLYVAGAVGHTAIERHEVHALSVDDGRERPGWPIDVAMLGAGTFVASSQNQRASLSLVNGILYVAYGGHTGGCGGYHGWMFAIDTARPASAAGWPTSGAGEGIDAPGGMASATGGIFAITGRNTSGTAMHMDGQEVVRFTGLVPASRADRDRFYPASWRQMDTSGADLGSSSPMLIEVPGAGSYLVVLSGDGHMYLFDPMNLGGAGGAIVDFPLAQGAMSIRTAPTTYATSKGTYVALTAASGVTCPVGSPAPPVGNTGQVVVSVSIAPGHPPRPTIAWCYYLITGQGSPVSTSTDGHSDAIVWFMNDVKLLGLDGDTGREVYDGTHDVSGIPFADRTCPNVRPWTSPIAVNGRMVVAASGRLCTWAPQARLDDGGMMDDE